MEENIMRVSLLNTTWLWPFTRRTLIIVSLVLVMAALILWRLSVPSANAADQILGGSTPSASTVGLGVASGAAEDTLKACLARIPKEASAGQRMIAAQGCERDEGDRKLIQAVPGR
jgi:hypothetical protein